MVDNEESRAFVLLNKELIKKVKGMFKFCCVIFSRTLLDYYAALNTTHLFQSK
jgi:hypothetical protein